MRDDKQIKIKSLNYLDSHARKKLKSRISDLNRIYENYGLFIDIKDIKNGGIQLPFLKRISLVDKTTMEKEIGNFFFYPKYKIFEFDGQEKKHFGYKVCFVKLEVNDDLDSVIKEVSINLCNKALEKGVWLKEKDLKGFNLDKDKFHDFDELMKAMLNKKWNYKNEIVLSSVIGWVQAREGYHYVPITKSKSGIKFTENIKRTFKQKICKDMDETDAYQKMKELLDVAKQEITIPLLSLTVLSSLSSLIKKHSKVNMDFMLCICGDNGRQKETLANLFCNIYNRTSHIYEIDSSLHVNQGPKTDLSEKVDKLRDAVFICKVSKNGDLRPLSKLLNQSIVSSGILLISPTNFKNDSVINIDITGAKVEKSIIQYNEKNPSVFSTWFSYFIKYIQDTLQDKFWGRELSSLYKDSKKRIEAYNQAKLNPSRLKQCAWLLTGFSLFEYYGREIGALNEEEFQSSLKEAIAIFHKLCAIDNVKKQEKHHIPLLPLPARDAFAYLYAVDKILNFNNVVPFGEKLPKGICGGWFDDDKIYLRNTDTLKEVKKYLKDNEIISLESKTEIYKYLYEEIGVITEKGKDGYGINIQPMNERLIHLDIQKSKKFLSEHGCELEFLKNL